MYALLIDLYDDKRNKNENLSKFTMNRELFL
jgi:hypothetical protein